VNTRQCIEGGMRLMVKGGILDTSSKVASDGILKVNTDASSKVNIGRNTKGEYRTHH